jgi:hypothetical protein
MADLVVVKEENTYNDYGEKNNGCDYIITDAFKCVEAYPQNYNDAITEVGSGIEGTRHYYNAWINFCGINDICDIDITEGYYVYFQNKYWKLINIKPYNDCGCWTVKLTLERLTPRETAKKLVECVSCL